MKCYQARFLHWLRKFYNFFTYNLHVTKLLYYGKKVVAVRTCVLFRVFLYYSCKARLLLGKFVRANRKCAIPITLPNSCLYILESLPSLHFRNLSGQGLK